MQCKHEIYIEMMIEQHKYAIQFVRMMKLMGTRMVTKSIPVATQTEEPEAKTVYELLDADHMLYDEIQDMEIDEVINGYMDEEIVDDKLLDADYELCDEIQDIKINDVINGYMDEEIVMEFDVCELVDNDLLYDAAKINEFIYVVKLVKRKIKGQKRELVN